MFRRLQFLHIQYMPGCSLSPVSRTMGLACELCQCLGPQNINLTFSVKTRIYSLLTTFTTETYKKFGRELWISSSTTSCSKKADFSVTAGCLKAYSDKFQKFPSMRIPLPLWFQHSHLNTWYFKSLKWANRRKHFWKLSNSRVSSFRKGNDYDNFLNYLLRKTYYILLCLIRTHSKKKIVKTNNQTKELEEGAKTSRT